MGKGLVGWLVSHAPRGRGENRFSLSAARIMAGGGWLPGGGGRGGLLHGNSIPWYEFSLVTLNREISPPRSGTTIVLRQSDRVIFPIPSFLPPFPSASCVWCTRSFYSLRLKKVEGKGREKFLKIWNESIRIINWTRSKKNNVKLRINVVPAFQEKKDCCLEWLCFN